MAINWNKAITEILDLGGENYENRVNRLLVKAGFIGLFLIVVWRFLHGSKN